jgi:hypothetical protein
VVLQQVPSAIYTSTVSSLDELLHYATEVHYEVAKSGMVVANGALAARNSRSRGAGPKCSCMPTTPGSSC